MESERKTEDSDRRVFVNSWQWIVCRLFKLSDDEYDGQEEKKEEISVCLGQLFFFFKYVFAATLAFNSVLRSEFFNRI